MPEWLSIIITATAAVLASTGFWSYLEVKDTATSARVNLLKGIGYFALNQTALEKIRKGYVTPEQYTEMYRYLYEPYVALGGNGSAERLMELVSKLPQRPNDTTDGLPPKPEDI